ncbi:hypothetical protein GUITHDRAFT_150548, partial [Guillardia theta CCMP2712]
MSLRQNVAYAGSGAISIPGRQGKMGGGSVQDLSAYMEEFCSSVKNVPAEIKRNFALINSLDSKVIDLKDKINQDSQVYSSAKNRNSTDMIELKKSIDKNQTDCLQYSEEKVSTAQACLELVASKLKQLDDDISNIDESLFTNQNDDAEEEPTGRGAGRPSLGANDKK